MSLLFRTNDPAADFARYDDETDAADARKAALAENIASELRLAARLDPIDAHSRHFDIRAFGRVERNTLAEGFGRSLSEGTDHCEEAARILLLALRGENVQEKAAALIERLISENAYASAEEQV